MICLFSLPIITGCIRRSLSDVLPEWWGSRSTVVALLGLLVFVMALRATEWPAEGGGIIIKIGLKMGALGTPFILVASYFGFVAAILFSMRSATNALLAGTFLAPFFILPFFWLRPQHSATWSPRLRSRCFCLPIRKPLEECLTNGS